MSETIIARNLKLRCNRSEIRCLKMAVQVHVPLELCGLGLLIRPFSLNFDDSDPDQHLAFINDWCEALEIVLNLNTHRGPFKTNLIKFNVATDRDGAASRIVGNANFETHDQVMLFPDETYVIDVERSRVPFKNDIGISTVCDLWGRLT